MILTNDLSNRGSTGIVSPLPPKAWGRPFELPEINYPVGVEKSTSQAIEIIPTDWGKVLSRERPWA